MKEVQVRQITDTMPLKGIQYKVKEIDYMGIFSRFSDIIKSNVNDMLDKCEDPEKMVDQTLRDLREDLAQVKKETAGVMADAREASRRVQECEEQIQKYTKAAQNAVLAGKDDDARKLLTKKQQLEEQLVSLQKTAEISNANAERVRKMHDKLVADIEVLETKRTTIKATQATAKAQERINKMQDGGKRASSSIDAFNRMEAKANKALDEAMAHSELNAGDTSSEDLLDMYGSGGSSTSVDDELAALKASMGK